MIQGHGRRHVMGDVEEQTRAERVLLRFRGEHALGNVAAAARLGAGIPDGPPLDGDRHDEHRHGDIPVVREIRAACSGSSARRGPRIAKLVDQSAEAAHLRQLHGEVSGGNDGRHLDEELDHVDDQHAPEAGVGGEHDVEQADRSAASASGPGRTECRRSCRQPGSPLAMMMQLKNNPR